MSFPSADEAHRATGKYSYCNIVERFEKQNLGYRVLALSATPGNDIEQVQEVVLKLSISKLVLKDEEDSDVRPYVHAKLKDIVVIGNNECLAFILDRLNQVIQIPFRWLLQNKMIPIKVMGLVKRTVIILPFW